MTILLLVLALQADSDWPTYHGGYGLDGVARVAVPDGPERLWRFKAGDRIESAPVVGGGRVYVVTVKNALFAMDAASGAQAWKAEVGKDFFTAPPLYTDGTLVAGTANGALYAFDAATGKERWKYGLDANFQSTPNRVDLPGGKKGVIAVSQADGCIHCVDLETGKLVWKTEPVERCDGSPSVGAGQVFMGSCASALHVYSLEKAAKVADVSIGGDNQIAGGVAFSKGVAFAGARSGKLIAVDVAARKLLWTNEDSRREAFATPAVNDAWAVFASDDGKIYGLDRATGKKAWEFDTEGKPSSPVIAGSRVVVASKGSLFILDLAKGSKVWSEELSDEITSPAVAGGRIFVGADDGSVGAYGRK
jgi:outer membrane protein assembly factor BamB